MMKQMTTQITASPPKIPGGCLAPSFSAPNSVSEKFFRFRDGIGTAALKGRFGFDETPVEPPGKSIASAGTLEPEMAKREISGWGSAAALILALAALLGGPGLFWLQSSWTNSPDEPVEPVYGPEETARRELARLGDEATAGKPVGIVQLAACLIRNGDRVAAESWLRHGAAQLRAPLLMLMYGDFLRGAEGRSALRLADFWYARAEASAREGADGTAGLEQFRQAVRERRRSVRTELEK